MLNYFILGTEQTNSAIAVHHLMISRGAWESSSSQDGIYSGPFTLTPAAWGLTVALPLPPPALCVGPSKLLLPFSSPFPDSCLALRVDCAQYWRSGAAVRGFDVALRGKVPVAEQGHLGARERFD